MVAPRGILVVREAWDFRAGGFPGFGTPGSMRDMGPGGPFVAPGRPAGAAVLYCPGRDPIGLWRLLTDAWPVKQDRPFVGVATAPGRGGVLS